MLKAFIISLFIIVGVFAQSSDNLVIPSTLNTIMTSSQVFKPAGYELIGLYYPKMDTLAFITLHGGVVSTDDLSLLWKDSVSTTGNTAVATFDVDSTAAGYIPLDKVAVEPLNWFWLSLPDSTTSSQTFKWIFRLEK